MDNENSNFKDTKLEKIKYAIFAVIGLLMVIFGSLYDFQPSPPKDKSNQLDKNLPPDSWNVTEDLGYGEVPGGPTAQRFELKQDQGWEVLAYCLNPEEPAPPVGTSCGMIDDTTFWCGDEYQQLREYEILQQPPSEQEDIPAATATNTSTATPTSTQTPTATNVPTNAPTNTTVAAQSFTATPRPKMGGDGNFNRGNALSLILGFLMIGIGISLTVVDWNHYISPFKKG